MLIGIYGLLFEGYNPGAVFPGVVGAICLLLALFAFQILSVNYAGLALVALGVGMIIAEFFFPAFGSLGLGGLIAFVVGSLILFDTDVPGMNIGIAPDRVRSPRSAAWSLSGHRLDGRALLRRPVVTGVQGMIGEKAEVVGRAVRGVRARALRRRAVECAQQRGAAGRPGRANRESGRTDVVGRAVS